MSADRVVPLDPGESVPTSAVLSVRLDSEILPVRKNEILPVSPPAGRATEQSRLQPNVGIAILMAVTFYGLIYFALRPLVFSEMSPDFTCLYRVGKMVVDGDGGHVYDLVSDHELQAKWEPLVARPGHQLFKTPFLFAPFVLAIFAPLSLLTYAHAELVWFLLNVVMLACIPFLLRRQMGLPMRLVASDLVAPAVFIPVCVALIQGQPSILLLLLFTLAFLELRAGHDFQSGCILALATFKPQLVLPLLLALFLARKWRALSGFAGVSSVLFGGSVLLVGWRGVAGFIRALKAFDQLPTALGGPLVSLMPTIRGMLYNLLQNQLTPTHLNALSVGLSLAVMLPAVFYLRHRLTDSLGFSALIAVTLLTSYHCYLHDFSLLLLPIFLSTRYAIGKHLSTSQKNLRLTVDVLFVAPVIAHWLTLIVLAVFLGTLALAVQQIVELQCEFAGILTTYPTYAPVSATAD